MRGERLVQAKRRCHLVSRMARRLVCLMGVAAHAALAGKVTWAPGSALLIDTRNGLVRISGRDLLGASVVEKTGTNDLVLTSSPVGVSEIRVRQGNLRTSEPDLIPPAVKVLSLGGQFLNNGG